MAYYHSKASAISHVTMVGTHIFIFMIRRTKQAMLLKNPIKHYLRLSPQSRRELRSSGLLHSE
jgi:hypothetical protein